MMTAVEPELRTALTTSFILHGVIALAVIFGMPHMPSRPLEMVQPIAVDIVDLGPVTTTQVQGTGQVAKKNDMAPAPVPAPPKPAAAQPKPAKPSTPPPTAKPATPPAVDEKDALSSLIKAESKKAKIKPEKPKEEKANEQFGSLLKNLSKQKPVANAAANAPKSAATAPAAAAGAPGIVSSKLTISEEDLLRRQIEQCWNIPMGARDAQNLIIEIRVAVNPDKTVKSAEVVDTGRMNDPFYRAAAESARRAVLNPRCSPLNLPEGKEDLWQSMTLRFNPQDVL